MRWSALAVRYQVPLLVVWSALIAVSFERYRAIGRAVGLAVLVACLPQLLDNHARSLLHPRYPFPTPLAAYFQDADDAAKAYGDVTAAVAQSQCQNLGIANRVLGEYPLWAGLRERGWTGRIAHVGVTNESSRLADVTFPTLRRGLRGEAWHCVARSNQAHVSLREARPFPRSSSGAGADDTGHSGAAGGACGAEQLVKAVPRATHLMTAPIDCIIFKGHLPESPPALPKRFTCRPLGWWARRVSDTLLLRG